MEECCFVRSEKKVVIRARLVGEILWSWRRIITGNRWAVRLRCDLVAVSKAEVNAKFRRSRQERKRWREGGGDSQDKKEGEKILVNRLVDEAQGRNIFFVLLSCSSREFKYLRSISLDVEEDIDVRNFVTMKLSR